MANTATDYTVHSRYEGAVPTRGIKTEIDLERVRGRLSAVEFAKLGSLYAEIAQAQEKILADRAEEIGAMSLLSLNTTFNVREQQE